MLGWVTFPHYSRLAARNSPEHKLRGPDIVPELAGDGHRVSELDVLLPGAEDGGPGLGDGQAGHQGPDAGGGGGLTSRECQSEAVDG